MQLPSNMIITRVRPSIYLAFWVCVWSCISASTAAAKNFSHLIAIRFLLGIAEAPFFPGVFFLLSCWYTKGELAKRTAVLYSGLILATAFSGLIAAGVFAGLDGARGLAGWRWLFLIEGVASFVAGVVAWFVLPDFPHSSTGSSRWLLTEDERAVAVLRMKRDRVSEEESNHSVWYGLKLAVADYRTWIFVSGVAPRFRLVVSNTDSRTGGHAHCEPYRIRFQLFLSVNCERIRTRLKHHHTSPHCTSIPCRNGLRTTRSLLKRPSRRARLARLKTNGCRRSRLRDFGSHPQHRRAVLRILPFHLWMLLRERWRLQLGLVDTEPVAREEVGSCGID